MKRAIQCFSLSLSLANARNHHTHVRGLIGLAIAEVPGRLVRVARRRIAPGAEHVVGRRVWRAAVGPSAVVMVEDVEEARTLRPLLLRRRALGLGSSQQVRDRLVPELHFRGPITSADLRRRGCSVMCPGEVQSFYSFTSLTPRRDREKEGAEFLGISLLSFFPPLIAAKRNYWISLFIQVNVWIIDVAFYAFSIENT